MRWPRNAFAAALFVSLLATGTGVAAARPADGFRNTQDYAYVDLGRQLDDCHRVDAWVALVAGDRLKNPIDGGAPRPWSDVTVTMWVRDDCAGTVAELTGYALAAPDITRLERASVSDMEVTITDASGEIEAVASGSFEWVATGPATTIIQNDPPLHIRSDRVAPADAVGGLVVTDADGDVWPGGIQFPAETISNASIGWANEIVLCCP